MSVITAFPHYENFRVWDQYRGKLVQRARYGSMDVVRLYVYAPGKKSMVNRLVSYLHITRWRRLPARCLGALGSYRLIGLVLGKN